MAKGMYKGKRVVATQPSEIVGLSGKALRVGTDVMYDDGSCGTVLNTFGKSFKAQQELKYDCHITNQFDLKSDEPLTDAQRAYRSGYIAAQRDAKKQYKGIEAKKAQYYGYEMY